MDLSKKTMTYKELLETAAGSLKKHGIEEADADALMLLMHVFEMDRTKYLMSKSEVIGAGAEDRVRLFEKLLRRRESREPLSQIIGSRNFMGFEFVVNASVLTPRPETEGLVEEVLKVSKEARILDLCTGSGCIAVSVALLGDPEYVCGADISQDALEVAKRNAEMLAKDREIKFVQSDLFSRIPEQFDIIVSNPPYIKSAEIAGLEPEVKDHEPHIALDGAADGLYFYRKIIEKAPDYLNEGGHLFFEIGYDEAEDVTNLLKERGFTDIEVKKDLAGLDRVICAVSHQRFWNDL